MGDLQAWCELLRIIPRCLALLRELVVEVPMEPPQPEPTARSTPTARPGSEPIASTGMHSSRALGGDDHQDAAGRQNPLAKSGNLDVPGGAE